MKIALACSGASCWRVGSGIIISVMAAKRKMDEVD